MLFRGRFSKWQLGGSAIQLVLLIFGAQFESLTGWAITAAAIALVSLVLWIIAWRHVRAVADTPTSKIVSAAQGYVELQGRGRAFDGPPLLSKLSQTPCLWFRYQVEHRRDDQWDTEDQGESDGSFILDDGSGECLIDPEGAQVLTRSKKTWQTGEYRYTEWFVHPGQNIYALGQFVTRGSVDLRLSLSEDMRTLLAEWKQNPAQLHKRFDLNGDGELDLREWELARAQARREVLASHREARQLADVHVMHLPPAGQLYLLATIPPENILLRYRLWAGFHLLCFFAALGGLGWLLPQL